MTQYLVAMNECHHTVTFQRAHLPALTEEIWCMKCAKYRTVSHILGMFRATCQDCRYSRWYGAAKIMAQIQADKHARRYQGHTVEVYLGAQLVSQHAGAARQRGQDTLDSSLDVPPF